MKTPILALLAACLPIYLRSATAYSPTVGVDTQTFDLQVYTNNNCAGNPHKTYTISLAELNIEGSDEIDSQSGAVQTFGSARVVNVDSHLFGQNLVVGICNDGDFSIAGPNNEPRCNSGQPGVLKLTSEPSNCAENQDISAWIFQFCPFPNGDCQNTILNP